MKNNIKDLFKNGKKSVGTFFELGSSTAAQCLALCGWDYVIVDNEHGPFDPDASLDFVRTLKANGTVPFARAQGTMRADILKLLDIGAMGIIIPCIKTAEEVEKIVEYGKYAPLGNRGVACATGSDFWTTECAEIGLKNYFDLVNNETLLIPQCETAECLESIEEIASIKGVDGIFVGIFDLSAAMGIPGEFNRPEFIAALKRIQAVCKKNNKLSIIFAGSAEAAKSYFELGYDSVTYSMDAMVFIDANKKIIEAIRP